jgi:hypothetical protein
MSSLTTRMLPANASGGSVTGVCGSPNPNDPSRRYYSASAGQTIDAQGLPDADAALLVSQGFLLVAPSGTTALRNTLPPGYFKAGQLYADLSLGKLILFDGANWRDPISAAVV